MSKWQLFGCFTTISVVKTDIQAIVFITIKTKQVKYGSGSLILVIMNAKKNRLKIIRPWTLKKGVYDFIFELQRTYLPRPHDKMTEFFYVLWLYLMYKHPDVSLRTKAFHYHDHPTLEWKAGLCLHLFLITPSHRQN